MTNEMSDQESASVFAQFAYPYPDIENADELQDAFVNGWISHMRRDNLAETIRFILSDEWLRGRVLPRMVGAEDQARVREIRRVLDDYSSGA